MIAGNRYLSFSEMTANAKEFADYMLSTGRFNAYSVAAMLGNMQEESGINPGIWENLTVTKDESNGYGLTQWTPASKVRDWLRGNNYPLDSGVGEMNRIIYELDNGIQFAPSASYNMTFQEFAQYQNNNMTDEEIVRYLADVFLKNYERPRNQSQPIRGTNAWNWWLRLGLGNYAPSPNPEPDPDPIFPPSPEEPQITIIMLMPNGCAMGYGTATRFIVKSDLKIRQNVFVKCKGTDGIWRNYRYIGSNCYKYIKGGEE